MEYLCGIEVLGGGVEYSCGMEVPSMEPPNRPPTCSLARLGQP